MNKVFTDNFKSIAMVFSIAMLFFSCKDNYKRVGEEAKANIFPQGVAKDFVLTYTETKERLNPDESKNTRVMAVMTSSISNDFDNLKFPYRTFPEGVHVDFFDDNNEKSTITADYGIIYGATNVIDLQGNVVIASHDGKKLETTQLYWDQGNEWIFTQEKFTFTNPEDGTVMDGEGMDFNKDLSFLNAHKTYGLMLIKEENDD
ncbi:LPS export ABC transporter periplasmic protein LptC [uncultured Maribacter sp.]|uniref:LPS export ABC transporter periplasmic protein LptC n=1 Tax=uncultured Maribacter sp. TaxID=431308 RepID=UPI0026353438|nr:LPS export ABC transporter periplasmic protein LptC [uncultured Maribacter sp.]